MRVSAIVAVSRNRVIGKGGGLPWRIPEDLKKFKSITTGHPIIMGRKTFESLPKILPGRIHLVISREPSLYLNRGSEGVHGVNSLEKALEFCMHRGEKEAFVIGGAQIYELAFPLLDRFYLTLVNQDFEGDTYLSPKICDSIWGGSGIFQLVSREDLPGNIPSSFLVLDKK